MKHFQNTTHAMLAFQAATVLARGLEKGHHQRIQDPVTGKAGNMCAYKYSDGSKKVVFDSWEVAREVYPKLKDEEFERVIVRTMTETKEVPALGVIY